MTDGLPSSSAFCRAAGSGNLSQVKLLLSRTDIQETDEYANTALIHAVWGAHIPVIQLLLERLTHAGINHRNADGNTPLHFAIARGPQTHSQTIQLLLQHGADMHIENHQQVSPHQMAKENKAYEQQVTLRRLLELNQPTTNTLQIPDSSSHSHSHSHSNSISSTTSSTSSTSPNAAPTSSGRSWSSTSNRSASSSNSTGANQNNQGQNHDMTQVMRHDTNYSNLKAVFDMLTSAPTHLANTASVDSNTSATTSALTAPPLKRNSAISLGLLQVRHLRSIFHHFLRLPLTSTEIASVLSRLDHNGDGSVDFTDFFRCMLVRSGTRFDQKWAIDKVFACLDGATANTTSGGGNKGDGVVGVDDYRAASTALGRVFCAETDSEITQILKVVQETYQPEKAAAAAAAAAAAQAHALNQSDSTSSINKPPSPMSTTATSSVSSSSSRRHPTALPSPSPSSSSSSPPPPSHTRRQSGAFSSAASAAAAAARIHSLGYDKETFKKIITQGANVIIVGGTAPPSHHPSSSSSSSSLGTNHTGENVPAARVHRGSIVSISGVGTVGGTRGGRQKGGGRGATVSTTAGVATTGNQLTKYQGGQPQTNAAGRPRSSSQAFLSSLPEASSGDVAIPLTIVRPHPPGRVYSSSLMSSLPLREGRRKLSSTMKSANGNGGHYSVMSRMRGDGSVTERLHFAKKLMSSGIGNQPLTPRV